MNKRIPFDVQSIRKDFPMLAQKMHGKPLVYLDSAATAQKPQVVIHAISTFYQQQYGTVHRAVYQFALEASEAYQETRKKIAIFLNAAKTEEIVFTKGTTDAINLVAYSFGKAFIQAGDEILISAMEHHSNIVPWQIMCQDRGAILKVIPMNQRGELLLEEYEKLVNSRTRLVAITHISNALGTCNPIKQIVTLAHQFGAKVLVDGAQSAPHIKVDVQDLNADFFVFSGHKMIGPTGIGILYGKEELLNEMPPYQGGGDMIDTVSFSTTTYNALPLKFEAGTPMIAEVIGLGVAVNYIESIGLQQIEKYETELLHYATQQMRTIPEVRIVGEAFAKGSLISFVVEGVHALDLGTLFDAQGIAIRTGNLCTQPILQFFNLPALARMSFAFYNTKEEIDYFMRCLQENIRLLK
jgi:cysteine desulfurase/selenocysteine lyase